MSHTPGPWKVDRPYIRGAGRAIATLESGRDEVEDAANARLTAAAPELLEELREMLDYAREALYWAGGEEETRGKAPRIKEDIERVEALLRRVEEGGAR